LCGITGIWNLNRQPVEASHLEAFNNSLFHRGPDGAGTYLINDVGLGLAHRRLSILDLSDAGKQPMSFTDESLVITFNGEIYNFIELREELKAKGYVFITNTDTEVILAAFKEWGKNCLERFNGMWAFAIWDKNKKELFLSRDRYGIKPLYYCYKPGKIFAFASESLAFGYLNGFNKNFNKANVSHGIINPFYLEAIGETIYEQINKLKPGHYISVSLNEKPVERRWWNTAKRLQSVSDDYENQVKDFFELFTDACKLRLRSDVPIGIALSGGLDSSAVYSTVKLIAASHEKLLNLPSNWQTAFIASFPGTSMDEKEYADEVISYYKGDACYIYPEEKNIAQDLVNQTKAEDFIFLSPPVVHSIYREMRNNGIKVSLDGHGADEMLFGYPDMIYEWASTEKNEEAALQLSHTWYQIMGSENQGLLRHIPTKSEIRSKSFASKLYNNLTPSSLKTYYRKIQHKKIGRNSMLPFFREYKNHWQGIPHKNFDTAFNISYRRFHYDFLPTMLRNWDRASMQHGVEIRMPFLDWRIVSFVFSLPGSSKVRNGFSKSIVRSAFKDKLPQNIVERKNKIGINAPMIEWLNGPLNTFLLDAVNSKSFLESDIWNGYLVKSEIEKLCLNKSWNQSSSNRYWPFINAWILMNS